MKHVFDHPADHILIMKLIQDGFSFKKLLECHMLYRCWSSMVRKVREKGFPITMKSDMELIFAQLFHDYQMLSKSAHIEYEILHVNCYKDETW